MLKGIPEILSPELIKIMMEMGHGDELIIADGNFPAAALAQRLVRADGQNVPDLLNAIITYFPLDQYCAKPFGLMDIVPGDPTVPMIWDTYKKILIENGYNIEQIESVERFEFYERAKKAYAIIATSEKALYANIILKKGVV